MRVLVTGHHGFIGSVTAPALEDAGHDVVGADVRFYEGCDFGNGNGAREPEDAGFDVRDVVPEQLAGFDAVVHLAALSNDPVGELDAGLTEEINFEGTMRLARAAREAKVGRFVLASSCSMYGASGDGVPVGEEAALDPLTAYARSKVMSERGLLELATDDFSPTAMRNATAYGASPRLRLDVVLNNLAAWAYTTGRVRILSDGTPWRPLVHVRDIAAATTAILAAPRDVVHAQAFNIGSDAENYRVSDIAEVVAEEAGGCEVEYAGTGDPDPRSYRVDFGKFRKAFPDFEFGWSARSGARELIDAFSATGFDRSSFEGDRYVRLRRIRTLLDQGALDSRLRWTRAPAAGS
jgi:nucleoside-diphosphate-sugar epimerase